MKEIKSNLRAKPVSELQQQKLDLMKAVNAEMGVVLRKLFKKEITLEEAKERIRSTTDAFLNSDSSQDR